MLTTPPMAGLARAFRTLVLSAPGTPERKVADAMRAHPEWTSGTSRDERRLMDAVPEPFLRGAASLLPARLRPSMPEQKLQKLAALIAKMARSGDYVVCLGAGSITQWAYALPGELAAHAK